ncbi:hypothetical protein HHL22_01595 [Hymenobacter sp. RP-2-7]|uniref:Uncharacterized protein n=1 Tax=Hymenobacter polaris TaxID=2682546 RepID=A0A7Y0AAR7_9BACT|nr:hypothetical protein [Hymenobacter polaris]NML63889.1 hypothetical protein [Hymenobacter polaris]
MRKIRAKVRKNKKSVPPKPPEAGKGFWLWLLQEALHTALAVAACHWLG